MSEREKRRVLGAARVAEELAGGGVSASTRGGSDGATRPASDVEDPALPARLTEAFATLSGAPVPAADRLLVEAQRRGLVDIAYGLIETPVGRLLAATTRRGLVRLSFTWEENQEGVLWELSRRVSPRILEAPEKLAEPRREIEEYFAGRRRDFAMALDWSLIQGYHREVLEVTNAIPYGQVSSYTGVAVATGRPAASRAAGNALGANPIPIVIPCHRVLRRDGSLGGYGGGLHVKRFLLRLEGVTGFA
ncbi:MAG TPA: methylated-DNA--[protein]-cysteine S-methyltransferase [Candidatus Dormibacteraeota bacterium]|jgi:methylated-DNA-[protein]-cysteine S-methyltransferase|nr:methylated-DNA--[protein]-cysteine S-methyltransferase [Candidatus Dormibacteraeota bacterium]